MRSQRGSVLSGVLIITAFIAIIAGALMTELSTNFLLSHNLVTKVANEASVNSGIELAISQLEDTQATPIIQPCPGLPNATLNGVTVVAAYTSCWPTIARDEPRFTALAGSPSGAFSIDGTHAQIGPINDYVVGNSAGTVFDYPFGATSPRWTLPLHGAVTGPPLVMRSPGGSGGGSGGYLDLIPLAGPDCSLPNNSYSYCLNVRLDNGSTSIPPRLCLIGAMGGQPIVTQPASSPTYSGVVYYADGTALEATDLGGAVGGCDVEDRFKVDLNMPVVAGPIAFNCKSCKSTDYVYAVVSDANSSRLIQCSYHSSLSCPMTQLTLPWGKAVGLAASGGSLPASLAITFRDGGVALVQVAGDGTMSLVQPSRSVGGRIAGAPYWCSQCPGRNLIGVGAQDGGLYLFDSSLNPFASSPAGGFPISTTPTADSAGNWYFATDNGYLHELQIQSGMLNEVDSYGFMGRIGSSPQLGSCQLGRQIGICVYMGSSSKNTAYMVPLDARSAVISTCISTAPPNCQPGANPRLQATIEVGSASSPQAVHVQGWSYYSG
jgi:hypothetical protein